MIISTVCNSWHMEIFDDCDFNLFNPLWTKKIGHHKSKKHSLAKVWGQNPQIAQGINEQTVAFWNITVNFKISTMEWGTKMCMRTTSPLLSVRKCRHVCVHETTQALSVYSDKEQTRSAE